MNFIINVKEKSKSDETRTATVNEEIFYGRGEKEDEQQFTTQSNN